MKIVDVCAFYSPQGGGVKTYVEQKLKIAPQLGHQVTIIAPGDRHEQIERGNGAKIVTLPSPRFPLDRKYWYFADEAALHAALDSEKPDFVEASSPWRSPSMVARWDRDVPRSLIMHADPLSAYAYRWLEPVFSRPMIDRQFSRFWDHLRTLGQSFDRVVCASRDLQQRLAAGGMANSITIPMGIEADLFSPEKRDPELRRTLLGTCGLPENAHLLIGVGRLSAEKRWPMVIDAVTAASQSMPIGLVLYGEGNERTRIERRIAGNPHIRLMGAERDRERFAALLASADALIHGCEAETFCMAAAEARASGLPIIAPDRGGITDHVEEGCGILYQSGNALSAARAVARQLARPRISSRSKVMSMTDHFEALFETYQTVIRKVSHAA